ncbi:SGNH/GDSL hydrolase family protein, partial [Reinekea sp.]
MKHFVFIGDSVTDSNRKRSKKYAGTEAALGHGWVKILAETALSDHSVWNRGFSGYRTADILIDSDIWPEEVFTADVTTLMVGINDIW